MSKQQLNTKQTANIKRQNDTTNTAPEGARIETGWGIFTGVSGTTQYTETITFSTAFTDKPIVIVTPGGDALTASGTTYGTGASTISADWVSKATNITNSSFSVYLKATTFSANGYVWYQWMAIGV